MSDMSQLILVISTFLFVIALIALGVWGFRAFFSNGNSGPGFFRPRERRLGVGESVSIDGKRKLVLVRRDDREHLLMIGGPVDVIIETGIESRQPLEHPLEDVVIDHGERRSPDRPLVEHPLVGPLPDRSLMDRPMVDRPMMDRPIGERPIGERPVGGGDFR